MKIAEKWKFEDEKLILKSTFSATPAMDFARKIKDAGKETQGENKVLGVVPYPLWLVWAKKWGVSEDDRAGMLDVLKREMQNPDNRNLRVWSGTF